MTITEGFIPPNSILSSIVQFRFSTKNKPEDSGAAQPEDSGAAQPGDSDAAQPEDSDAAQPEDSGATQPEDSDAAQPKLGSCPWNLTTAEKTPTTRVV